MPLQEYPAKMLRGQGKVHTIPVHEARRQLATEKGFGSIGWHTFRHTYRSLLSGAGTPLATQQTLLRHADIATTQPEIRSPMENRRRANSLAVKEVLLRKSAR